MSSERSVLVVTRGHPFEAEPFFAMFDALDGVAWTHVEHPEARDWFRPDKLAGIDAVVCYDMPGIAFTGGDPPTRFEEPPAEFVEGFEAVLAAGQGIVFLHHAVASWPAWPRFAEIVGARFHYQPGELRGVAYPDSGYQFDVTHRVEVLDTDHPVCAGLGDGFTLTDELYLYPVFEDDVVPLLRSDADFSDERFSSADRAIRGRGHDRDGWHHPEGSKLIGWVRGEGRSPLVYLQPGDGPVTYADPSYRRLLANAIDWVATPAAHDWAASRVKSRD
ncbi:MAG: ThuA domain-containing protein [Myxococcota bacterium]|jgi:hypothetical protein|nr:ThuA domain-containing protein [Myxococcota bacterium]